MCGLANRKEKHRKQSMSSQAEGAENTWLSPSCLDQASLVGEEEKTGGGHPGGRKKRGEGVWKGWGEKPFPSLPQTPPCPQFPVPQEKAGRLGGYPSLPGEEFCLLYLRGVFPPY